MRRLFYQFHASTKSPLAAAALARIASLYAIEAEIRGTPAEYRRAVRTARRRSIVEELHVWPQQQVPRISNKGYHAHQPREPMMQVSEWGNSIAVHLPRALVERLKLQPGDSLEVVAADAQRIAVDKVQHRDGALAGMAARAWQPPANFRFNRDDANAR